MERWRVAQGIALSRTGTAVDAAGKAVTAYTGAEEITGVIWAGDEAAPLITFAPAWLVPAQGTYAIALTPAQTAMLEPGTYTVDIRLADGSADFLRAQLDVLPSAGTAAPLFSYVTFGQLTRFAGQVDRLQDAVADETGFAEQRAQASQDFDRMVLARYRPQPGRSRRYLAADGSAPGPYPVFAPGPGGAPPPTRAAVAALLGTPAVMVNADVVECVARLALSIIYLGQPGRDSPYRESGNSERGLALQAFRRCQVEIDTDADGVAELRLDQDVTFLT